MAKSPRKVYDLAEVIKNELEQRNPLTITAGDKTFTVPPATLWPDRVFEVSDTEGAKILLGEQYDDWCAAGGTAKLLFTIYAQHNGATVPE